jgi:tetratricopeptide (TPR) repeat protein
MKICVFVIFAVALLKFPVLGQKKQNINKAQARFNIGAAYFKDGKYEEALVELKVANEMFRHKDFVYNIARCYEKLKKYENAILYLKEFLKMNISQQERKEAKEKLKTLKEENETGELVIIVPVEGAEIFIDSNAVGASPLKSIKLQKGNHSILVKKQGFRDFSYVIDIKPHEKNTLDISFEKLQVMNAHVKPETVGKQQEPVRKQEIIEKRETIYKVWKWVGAAGGIALVGSGIAMTIVSNNKYKEVDDAKYKGTMTMKQAQSLLDEGETYRTLSYVFYGIGGIGIAASGILFYLDLKNKDTVSSITFVSSPYGFAIERRF